MATPFEISSEYVDDLVAHDPLYATRLGLISGEWPDWSPDGHAASAALARRYIELLVPHADHPDFDQRLAARVLARALSENVESLEQGDHLDTVRHMASPFHWLRSAFDVMPVGDEDEIEAVHRRLATIDQPLEGYEATLRSGLQAGRAAARRQVRSMIEQARRLAGDESALFAVLDRVDGAVPGLADAIHHARSAMGAFADFLETDYMPLARQEDHVGEERYRRAANRLVGLDVAPSEAYEWGWSELNRLVSEMRTVAEQIRPGGDLEQVKHLLETDPERAAHSAEEFIEFISGRQERALSELDGAHFDVPEEIREVTVQMAPPGGPLGAYYIGPSEDFSRPGGIWYSLGDQTTFPLYHQVSTAYHEGFPGHHLQVGTAVASADRISRGQRLTVWYPGYGEGWAMYAERLMGELGYLETPDYVFGMLAKQLYRAVRIVVDIGLHLGLAIPDDAPLHAGEPWTFDGAVDYLKTYGFRTEAQAPNEVLRYLGWPGQAIAYKLGEREILSIREAALERGMDLRSFHRRVLQTGAMRLDLLREVVLE